MSQHLKSLFQQLQPLFNSNIYQNNTPTKTKSNKFAVSEKSSQVKKEHSSTSTNQNKLKRTKNAQSSDESRLSSECSSTSSSLSSCYLTSELNKKRIKLQSNEIMTDSGLESSFATNKRAIRKKLNYCDEEEESQRIKSSKMAKSKEASSESRKRCVCSNCLTRLNRLNEVIRKLRQARHYYFKSNLNEKNFANIPMLIVKSFRPQSNSLNKIEIRKGSAINALFINENNKWLYVKTSNELTGFIPAKCCEPFYVNKYCQSKTGKSQSQTPNSLHFTPLTSISSVYSSSKKAASMELIPIDKPINKPDHTYMTISELDLKQVSEKQRKCESTCTPVSCDISNQTVLSLFSVSSNFHSEPHHNCNNCVSCCFNSNIESKSKSQQQKIQEVGITSNDSLVKYLKGNNKSRNRKIQLGLKKMPSAITLTMLEQHEQHESTYLNLADAQTHHSNANTKQQGQNLKSVQTIFEEESEIYEDLIEFKSQSAQNNNNTYDFLVSNMSSSTLNNSKCTESDNNYHAIQTTQRNNYIESDHYDVLMAYNSNSATKKLVKMKKKNEALKANMNLFQVTEDYTADFKGDLTVKRGDLVYLVEQGVEKECSNQNDWLYVRLYKRGRKSTNVNHPHVIYENLSDNCSTSCNMSLQGYVPRNHVVRL